MAKAQNVTPCYLLYSEVLSRVDPLCGGAAAMGLAQQGESHLGAPRCNSALESQVVESLSHAVSVAAGLLAKIVRNSTSSYP